VVKVEYKTLTPRKGRAVASKGSAVSKKSVRTKSGVTVTVRRLDADSETFSDDLRYVFEKNVEKARRENKKLTRGAAKEG